MPATSPAPIPEDEASHKRHITLLKAECKKSNPNKYSWWELVHCTFSFHCKELLEKSISVDNLLSTYSALKYPDEVIAWQKVLMGVAITSYMYVCTLSMNSSVDIYIKSPLSPGLCLPHFLLPSFSIPPAFALPVSFSPTFSFFFFEWRLRTHLSQLDETLLLYAYTVHQFCTYSLSCFIKLQCIVLNACS